MSRSTLLTLDAVINLTLGALLVVFPDPVVSALGIPGTDVTFYPSILGAVLVGIGIALVVERVRGATGLGLVGAVSINLTAGLVLAAWLASGSLALAVRGQVVLWAVVALLVGISTLELTAHSRGHTPHGE